MFLGDWLDDTQSFKCCIPEVTLPVVGTGGGSVTVSAFCGKIFQLIFAREETTSKGVVDDNVKAVPLTGGNKFGLNIAC